MSNKKTLLATIAACTVAVVVVGTVIFNAGVDAGDARWATNAKLKAATEEMYAHINTVSKDIAAKLEQMDINSLDRQITFLKIKINKISQSGKMKLLPVIFEEQRGKVNQYPKVKYTFDLIRFFH